MNWYKKAQHQMELNLGNQGVNIPQEKIKKQQVPDTGGEKKEKKPYYLVIIKHDVEERQKIKNVFAYSASQARMMFLNMYSYLRDYLQMGYDVEARIDKVELENIRQQIEQATQQKKRRKEEIDRFLQEDAWWNK